MVYPIENKITIIIGDLKMKLTEIKPVEKKSESETMVNVYPTINLTKTEMTLKLAPGEAAFVINLDADLQPSYSGKSIMIAKAKNSLIRLGDVVSTLNLNWYIAKSKNNLA